MRSKFTKSTRAQALRITVRRNCTPMGYALAIVFAACLPSARASLINFDPNGAAGGDTAQATSTFDFSPGNALLQNVNAITTPGVQQIAYYMQARLNSLLDANNKPLVNNLNSQYEITLVMGANAQATKTANSTSLSLAAGTNYFELFYDPLQNSNDLAGTGFDNGTRILSGTISNITGGFFVAPGTSAFDTNGNANNYPTLNTLNIVGGISVNVSVSNFDPAFFQESPSSLQFAVSTGTLTTPFDAVQPAAIFSNGVPNPANTANYITPVLGNGSPSNLNGTGSDFQVQNDASATFQLVDANVPEPGSFLLAGLGLLGILAFAKCPRIFIACSIAILAANAHEARAAFSYTFTDLGTAGITSDAFAINASGVVAGYTKTNTGIAAPSAAFYYDGTLHQLGTLGGTSSRAAGINSSGVVVGESDVSSTIDLHPVF